MIDLRWPWRSWKLPAQSAANQPLLEFVVYGPLNVRTNKWRDVDLFCFFFGRNAKGEPPLDGGSVSRRWSSSIVGTNWSINQSIKTRDAQASLGYPDRYLRCDGRPSTPVLCNEVSGANISRMVWPKTAKLYTDIKTDNLYSNDGCDFASYF